MEASSQQGEREEDTNSKSNTSKTKKNSGGGMFSFVVWIWRTAMCIVCTVLKPLLDFLSAKHTLPYATPNRTPPDPTLFPRYFQNKQGMWLHWTEWTPKKKDPIGVVFLVQGLGEHAARYDSIALTLVQAGYVCFSNDHQGQGTSEGDRKYVERFSDYVDDTQMFVKRTLGMHASLQTLPRILLGHSMGGLIAIHTAYRDPAFWNGVVLSAPAIEPDPKVATPLLKTLASFLSDLLPKLALDSLDVSTISRNRPVVELAIQDPLYPKGGLKARWGHEMLVAMDDVWSNMANSTFPFLLVHGTEDKICQLSGSRKFWQRALSNDKTIKEYEGMYHEVLTETQRHLVLADVMKFIQEHSK